jgi:hypothetical protein
MSDKVEIKWENMVDISCGLSCKECEDRCEEDKSIFGFDESKK